MNLSEKWLKNYINYNLERDELSEILTAIGLEVEGIEKVEQIKGGLKGVVVGHITECSKHPNADKLSVTKVDVGGVEPLSIVCGAPNVALGQKVLIATIGTVLYDAEGGDFKIKKGKIRGELSEGMICAEDELGLGNSHDGILVLPEQVPVGSLASHYYKLEDDHVFDIGLTPNRSDATCHLGVAKDLAAYLKVNKSWNSQVMKPDVASYAIDQELHEVKVTVDNTEACPRYSGVTLSNLTIGPSPEWIQTSLQAIGVRPINNVVDITNYVLHELGQPLHAFDLAKIGNKEIRVKTLADKTPFLSLDEQERLLLETDLMICDGNDAPMCIAGVFGGAHSGVTDTTTEIFLESAHFDAGYIRRSSTKHLLRTDAAKVYEKGSDPNNTTYALKRAVLLLKEYAGATVTSKMVDIYPQEIKPREILVSYDKVNKIIGTTLEQAEVDNILTALEMEVVHMDNNQFMVKVPTNKAEVLRDVDIIEEILRIYGFNKVPNPTQLKTNITYQDNPTKRQIQNNISNHLAANGFNEMMGLSLSESKKYDATAHESLVFVNNTSNIHLDVMRPEPILSGLGSVAHNNNHQQMDVKLFEYGKQYAQSEINGETKFVETEFLSLFITGKSGVSAWNNTASAADFYSIKYWAHEILNKVNITRFQVRETTSSAFSYGLEYYRGDKTIAILGAVSRSLLKTAGVSQDVFAAWIDAESMVKSAKKVQVEMKEISKYPTSSRLGACYK